MSQASSSSAGIGFPGMLTVLFVGLKLTGFVDWSWWWVLSPVLFVAGFVFLLIAITAAVAAFR